MTAVVANLLVADIAVSSDNREEFFGIDPLAQGRRAHDVDKCHGKLPALGMQSLALDVRRRRCLLRSARPIRLAVHDATMFSFRRACREARWTASRIRLTLPSGLCSGRQFQGLNTMCSQSYSRFCARKLLWNGDASQPHYSLLRTGPPPRNVLDVIRRGGVPYLVSSFLPPGGPTK
jgi:hypothetical protein